MRRSLRACGHRHPEFEDAFRLYRTRYYRALNRLIAAGADLRSLIGLCALELELLAAKPGPAQRSLFA